MRARHTLMFRLRNYKKDRWTNGKAAEKRHRHEFVMELRYRQERPTSPLVRTLDSRHP